MLTLVVLAAGVVPAWRDLGSGQTNVDAIAAHLERVADPDDPVIVGPCSDTVDPLLTRIHPVLASGHRVWFLGPINVPPLGMPLPAYPPPPLLPDSGWSVVPYEQFWSDQVGVFLKAHVVGGERQAIDAQGGPFESLGLTELSGWR